jgi:hypothetical protein
MSLSFETYNLFVTKLSSKQIYYDSSHTNIDEIAVKGSAVRVDFTYTSIYRIKEDNEIGVRMEINGSITSNETESTRNMITSMWASSKIPKEYGESLVFAINRNCIPKMILLAYAMEIPIPLKGLVIKRLNKNESLASK